MTETLNELDDVILNLHSLSDRDRRVADAARRKAFREAADWLFQKQAKSEQFPGGDVEGSKARASAYQNAAQEIYGWTLPR